VNKKFLSSDKELILINNIKNGVNVDSSLNILKELHSGIFFKTIHGYCSHPKHKEIKHDLLLDCDYYIYLSAKDFNETKGAKFSSYLGNRARWASLNAINKSNKMPREQFKQAEDLREKSEDLDLYESIASKEALEMFFNKDKTPDRIIKIFKLRYLDGDRNKLMSWKRIGEKVGLSIQGCINIHDNYLNKINKTKKYGK
jgi:hypothetical protein